LNTAIVNSSYIENELKKFSITDQAIAEMKQKYLPLKINGVDDKAGYAAVREARLTVKSKRIEVDKKRKELTEDALKFQRAINAEAKRIVNELEPIESYLGAQENEYEAEKERIKQEKERAEQIKLQERVNKLLSVGMLFNGALYTLSSLGAQQVPYEIDPYSLKSMNDQQFEDYFNTVSDRHEENKRYLAEIERQKQAEAELIERERKEEQARLEKMRQEQEAEKLRLEAIAREQEEKEKAILAEQKRLDDERAAQEEQKQNQVPPNVWSGNQLKSELAKKDRELKEELSKKASNKLPDDNFDREMLVASEIGNNIFETDIFSWPAIDPINVHLSPINDRWYLRTSYYDEELHKIGETPYIDIDLQHIIKWVKKFKPELLEF
jgi:hypothetical protein